MITTLAYHYVRIIKNSLYPNIKGLELDLFKKQIQYCKKYYEFIDYNDLTESIYGSRKLNKNSILLTFDDGFVDNYKNVFPILVKENIKACFYPITSTIVENNVADVHKIHFILQSINNIEIIKKESLKIIENLKKENIINDNFDEIYHKLAIANEDDVKDIIFFKRLFQHYLTPDIRSYFLNILFSKYVSNNEKEFSKNLYLSVSQIKEMSDYGMTFGNHTYNHNWLEKLKKGEQRKEMEKSLDFLSSHINGFSLNNWSIAYPYGSYNQSTIDICKDLGGIIGFTTKVNISRNNKGNSMTLERLDTNHLPKHANSVPNKWTLNIL